ncbi:MAG: PDZ domain-containing protein, partial [Pseudomonadota bacterium]
VMELVDPADARTNPAPKSGKPDKPALKPNRLGLIVEELDDDDKKAMSIAQGVVITDTSGPAVHAGLRPGDIILVVNTTEIKSVAQFNETLSKVDENRPVALLVKREQAPARYITLRPETK